MHARLLRSAIVRLLCAAALAAGPGLLVADLRACLQSRWVVDVVQSGDAKSEREHDFASDGASDGIVAGRAFRQAGASGWLRYTLRSYDDTALTVACLCRGTEGRRVTVELLIDGQAAGTHTLESPSAEPVLKEWRVPERLTRGKTTITLMLRGVGGPTPGVIELRTVQEHLE